MRPRTYGFDSASELVSQLFEQLECVHSTTIQQLFDKAMPFLWTQGVNHNKVLLFVTDAGSYMVKTAKNLKCHILE